MTGEEMGRSRKIAAITAMIDAELLAHEMNPFDPRVLGKLVARIKRMTAAEWTALVEKHHRPKLKPPSDKTLAVLIDFYEQRIAEVRAARRDPVPDVA